ncbi:MAG: hypothetical protein HQL98_06975 [Magnetococcales bacterium]|nr:hypothetical protein [Magnetococcales bacterium]
MWWFARSSTKKDQSHGLRPLAMGLYDRLATRALALTGGERLGIPDDFPLRFDVMILLVAGMLHRLRHAENGKELSQALWEMTYEGFEESLRSRGVTDMGMGRRMKKLVLQGTGRRDAYLAAWDGQDPEALRAAVARNVLNGADPTDTRIDIVLAEVENSAVELPSE